jgi:hypothetical protein
VVGPATLHQRLAEEYAVEAELPSADNLLLEPLRRSNEYRAIGRRLAAPHPVDSWVEDGLHFFVFILLATDGAQLTSDAPTAVFAMRPELTEPVSAIVVTPNPVDAQAEVADLREPKNAYTAPLPVANQAWGEVPPAVPDVNGAAAANGNPPLVESTTVVDTEPVEQISKMDSDADADEDGGELNDLAEHGTPETPAWEALLFPLWQSPVYEAIRARLADDVPTDSWQEDGLHYFAFDLRPSEEPSSALSPPPSVVFTIHAGTMRLISAILVTPRENSSEPEISELLHSEVVYSSSLPRDEDGRSGTSDPSVDGTRVEDGGVSQHESPSMAASEQNGAGDTAEDPEHLLAELLGLPGQSDADDRVPDELPPQGGTSIPLDASVDDLLHAARSLSTIEGSEEYALIRNRLADSQPIDSWQEDGLHFAVFELRPTEDAERTLEPPTAVFAIYTNSEELVSAVVVTPRTPEITDLREVGNVSAELPDKPFDYGRIRSSEGVELEVAGKDEAVEDDSHRLPLPEAEASSTLDTANGTTAPGLLSGDEGPEVADKLSADAPVLLAVVEASVEYRRIESRLAAPGLVDSWLEDGLHFFVFQLLSRIDAAPGLEGPVVVFAVRLETSELISAVVVTCDPDGGEPEIENVRQVGNSQAEV